MGQTQVILKSDKEELFRVGDPNGKEIVFAFNKANDFTLTIPVELTYRNNWTGKEEVFAPKFAQGLLNSHSTLHLVEEFEAPEVVERVIDKKGSIPATVPQAPPPVQTAAPPVVKKKIGRPRKEEKHEVPQEVPA